MDKPLAQPSALPLAHHRVFQSADVDEAREFVARIFCPHELSPIDGGGRLDACHHSALVHEHASINYVQYGAAVRIEPGYLREFFLLQMPLRGGASVRCGGQRVESHSRMASFPSPTEPLSMRWAEDSPQLIVRLDRRALCNRLEALLQAPLRQALVFDLAVDLAGAAGSTAALVGYLRHALEDGGGFAGHGPLAEQAENHLLTSLLLSLPHNHSAALAGERSGAPKAGVVVLPRSVKRAQEILRAHVEQPISLEELCTLTGSSSRSLQQAFARYAGCSPMAWLREVRLDHARAQLQAGGGRNAADGASVRVANVAANCGFFHLGHFAAHYRKRFGELPSQTVAG